MLRLGAGSLVAPRHALQVPLATERGDFGIEVEMSAQIARQRTLRIYELGISYFGRTYAEGKKISWSDGVMAVYDLIKYRFRD